MFSGIAPRYDLANRVLSLGQDVRWRRRLVQWAQPRHGERVLDLCTGTADLVSEFVRDGHALNLWGLDLSRPMLALGLRKLRRRGLLQRTILLQADALVLPFPSGSFDIVTIAFGLRNLPAVPEGIAEMTRVLRTGGRLLVLEFSSPPWPGLREIYLAYLKHIIPRLGGWIAGSREAYDYLHRSIRTFPSPDEILDAMSASGLNRVRAMPLTGGIVVIYRGERD